MPWIKGLTNFVLLSLLIFLKFQPSVFLFLKLNFCRQMPLGVSRWCCQQTRSRGRRITWPAAGGTSWLPAHQLFFIAGQRVPNKLRGECYRSLHSLAWCEEKTNIVATRKRTLNVVFAIVVFTADQYMSLMLYLHYACPPEWNWKYAAKSHF